MRIEDKSKIAAYMITEAVSDPAPVNNLKVIDNQGLFYLTFDTVLQDFNVFNRKP